MIKLNLTQKVLDNEIIFNGERYMVDDTTATRIAEILKEVIGGVTTTTPKAVTPKATTPKATAPKTTTPVKTTKTTTKEDKKPSFAKVMASLPGMVTAAEIDALWTQWESKGTWHRTQEAKNVGIAFQSDKGVVTLRTENGGFVTSKAVREIANGYLKGAGFRWNPSKKGWELKVEK